MRNIQNVDLISNYKESEKNTFGMQDGCSRWSHAWFVSKALLVYDYGNVEMCMNLQNVTDIWIMSYRKWLNSEDVPYHFICRMVLEKDTENAL